MKQKNKNQTLHTMIKILGIITILTGILLLADAALSQFLGANLWPLRIIVPGVVLFFAPYSWTKETALCGQLLVASLR